MSKTDLPSPADDLVERLDLLKILLPHAAQATIDDAISNVALAEAFMERIEDVRSCPFVTNWRPADSPAEIIVDLVNHFEDELTTLRAQLAAAEATNRDLVEKATRAEANYQLMQGSSRNWESAFLAAESQLASARNDAFQECIAIAEKYSDCGSDFIAQKIRDLALSQTTGG